MQCSSYSLIYLYYPNIDELVMMTLDAGIVCLECQGFAGLRAVVFGDGKGLSGFLGKMYSTEDRRLPEYA